MLKPRGDCLDNFNNINSTRLDLLPCLNTKGRPDQATINSKQTWIKILMESDALRISTRQSYYLKKGSGCFTIKNDRSRKPPLSLLSFLGIYKTSWVDHVELNLEKDSKLYRQLLITLVGLLARSTRLMKPLPFSRSLDKWTVSLARVLHSQPSSCI